MEGKVVAFKIVCQGNYAVLEKMRIHRSKCLTRLGFIKVMYFVKVFYWVSDIYKGIKSMYYLFVWIACKFSDKHVKAADFFNLKVGNGMYYLFIIMV